MFGLFIAFILIIPGVCDIVIIYTIFRFKRLRSAFNIFLANWAISDLLSIILLPINHYGLAAAIPGPSMAGINNNNNCILTQVIWVLHLTKILFGIVLCIDWCFAEYFQKVSEKFRKYYRYVIAFIWILAMLFDCFFTGLCIADNNSTINLWIFAIFYFFSLIFVIVLQCSKLAQRCRKLPINYPKPLQLRLTVITIIIFTYLFPTITILLVVMARFYHPGQILMMGILSACAILSSSVVTLILLCCLNYEFRQCLLRKPAHERFDNDHPETGDTLLNPRLKFYSHLRHCD